MITWSGSYLTGEALVKTATPILRSSPRPLPEPSPSVLPHPCVVPVTNEL